MLINIVAHELSVKKVIPDLEKQKH